MPEHGYQAPRLTMLFFWCVALATLGLTAFGSVQGFSPVPYWDMWDGQLAFYLNLPEAGLAAWWDQHNEHRILLTRLFFFADLHWLNGSGWLLILVNHLLAVSAAILFIGALRSALSGSRDRLLGPVLAPLLFAWLLLWMQHENFLWGFQIQFFLAQLLPALALFLLYRSSYSSKIDVTFIAACGAGVAALGTMANGVVALPLMALLAIVTRQGGSRIAILVALAIIGPIAYFYGFNAVESHGSLSSALRDNPIRLVRYVFLYLGSPFFYLAGGGTQGLHLATAAGAFMVATTAFTGIRLLLGPRRLTIEAAMLTFVVFIVGTAVATAGGRVTFGLEQALSSRYTTPALMGWAALLVAHARTLVMLPAAVRAPLLAAAAVLAVAIVVHQLQALDPEGHQAFERNAATLPLALQIHDPERIQRVYPDSKTALDLARRARDAGVTVLAEPPLRDAPQLLEKAKELGPVSNCLAFLDSYQALPFEPGFAYITGWVHAADLRRTPQTLQILDSRGKAVGVGITGRYRPDVAETVGPDARHAGFSGYIEVPALTDDLTVQGIGTTRCRGPLPGMHTQKAH